LGTKGSSSDLLDHRVAAVLDLHPGCVASSGRLQSRSLGALGQQLQHVQLAQSPRRSTATGPAARRAVEQSVVQQFLARQRALAGAQHLSSKRFSSGVM
jgi:hypothetical protein